MQARFTSSWPCEAGICGAEENRGGTLALEHSDFPQAAVLGKIDGSLESRFLCLEESRSRRAWIHKGAAREPGNGPGVNERHPVLYSVRCRDRCCTCAPFSQRETVATASPSCSAKSSCFKSSPRRPSRISTGEKRFLTRSDTFIFTR